MTVYEYPDRIININGEEYLYFGGTNYLGITTNSNFQNILFESIKKWGTAYGSSRNANIKLSIFLKAEKLLAKNIGSEAALTVSSGMLAGKLVVEHLSKTTDAMFHFPDTHPALICSSSLPIMENGKLNSKIFDDNITQITIFADAIPSLYVIPIDLSILNQIPVEKKIILVLDESHSIGIVSNDNNSASKIERLNNIHQKIVIASLGKAYGLSGGVIAGNSNFINEIRNQDTFVGASGMNPAFLETFVNAQELYLLQNQKLQQNMRYINDHFINRKGFIFNTEYPVIYFDDETISKKLFKDKIITTSFKYTSISGRLNRIVITANHKVEDLDKLIVQLNSNP